MRPARPRKADDAVRDACIRHAANRTASKKTSNNCLSPTKPVHVGDPDVPGAVTCSRDDRPMWRTGTYNAMSMVRIGRWDTLSREMQSIDFMGVQGTGCRADPDFSCSHFRSQHHHVFQWGYSSGQFSNKACGVAIMLRHKWFRLHHIRQIYSLPETLAGRAGALRIKGARADFLVVVGYVPVEPSTAAQRKGVQAFYAWMDSLLSAAPARTLPIIMLDANGRVGLHRGGPGPWQVAPGHDACVGPWGAEVENYNGSKLHEFLLQHHLAAANTHARHGCGKTFHGAHGHASRIDYILVPESFLSHVRKVRVWYRSAFRLQLVDSPELRDHCPVVLDFQHEMHFASRPATQQQWDFSKLATAVAGGAAKGSFLQAVEQQLQPHVDSMSSATVAELWHALNSKVCSVAREHFSLPKTTRAGKPADTVQAAEQTLDARQRYRAAFLAVPVLPTMVRMRQYFWQVWVSHVRFLQLQRRSKQLCRRDKQLRLAELVRQLAEAVRCHDLSLQWRLSYQLAGGTHGPKRRRYNMPQRYRPTSAEWVAALAQTGPDGGCSATPLDEESAGLVLPRCVAQQLQLEIVAAQHGRRLSAPPALVGVNAEVLATEDYEGLRRSIRTLRRGRAVPDWSAPGEVWRLLLLPAESRHGAVVPIARADSFSSLLRRLLVSIRQQQEVPLVWNLSSPAELDKSNGQIGCAGKRLIHKLDPLGKCFFHMLWSRQVDAPRHYACGFLQRRRREQAILQQRCLNWKLQKAGMGRVTVLYDVKNAFPSPSHSSLDSAVRRVCRPADVHLLCLRHRAAFILLRDPFLFSAAMVQIGCGNLQGDRMAPSQFLSVYHPAIDAWSALCSQVANGTHLVTRDPLSGLCVDTALSTFADDVGRTHVLPRVADFSPTVQALDSSLDNCLCQLQMGQNHDKKELLVRLMGKGSQLAMQRIYHSRVQFRGRCKRIAKYLGCLLHHSGATAPKISQRIATAKRNWYILHKYWFSSGTSLRQKLFVFQALVVAPMFAGLETLQTHRGDNVRLQKVLALLGRKLLQGRACVRPAAPGQDHPRSWTNIDVFRAIKVLPPEWERRARRLLWWQHIVRFPGENVLLLATIFGKYTWENRLELHADGRASPNANPWIQDLVSDLRCLAPGLPAPGLVPDLPLTLFDPPYNAFFVSLDIRTLLAHHYRNENVLRGAADPDAAEEDEEPDLQGLLCGFVDGNGAVCAYVARSTTALAAHKHRAHQVRITARQIVVCNQCPWCRRVFASVEIARRHAQARVRKGVCPRGGGGAAGMLADLRPRSCLQCPVCLHEAESLETLQTHVVTHVPAGQQVLHQFLP